MIWLTGYFREMDEEIKNELEKLSKDPSSGFKVLKTNIHIALGPSALGNNQI